MSCTCNSKSFLHTSECGIVQGRAKSALYLLLEEAFNTPNGYFYYVTPNDIGSAAVYELFKSDLSEEDWMFTIETRPVYSIILNNNCEVTFLPEAETVHLKNLPVSNRVYVEATDGSKDISAIVTETTRAITMVDPKTKEVL